MTGAAAVAQKDENGGGVSKTSVNKQRSRVSWIREWMLSSCYRWYLRADLFSHVLHTE